MEGLADEILDRLDIRDPVSAWEIVGALEVRVVHGGRGVVPTIEFDPTAREWLMRVDGTERMGRLEMRVLHEVSHPLLKQAGLPDTEDYAWALAAALLLPRSAFLREVRRHGGRLDELAQVFPHASSEAIARRAVELADSLHLWVWDVQPRPRRPRRVLSPGWRWDSPHPTTPERDALECARRDACAVEPIGGVRAWPVLDDPYERVLCVADGEVLLALT